MNDARLNFTELLRENIIKEIESQANELAEEYKKQFDKKISEIITRTSINLFQYVEIQNMGNRLVIEIKKYGNEPKK